MRTVLTLEDVARLVTGRVEGDSSTPIRGVAPIEDADPDQLGLFADKRYSRHLGESRAGAILVSTSLESLVADKPRVVADDPHAALVRLLPVLHPSRSQPRAIHPTALVDPSALLGEDVGIGAYSVVGPGAVVGDGCVLAEHVVVGRNVNIGAGCRLYPHVTLYEGTTLGERVIIHAGSRIGVDGFGYAPIAGELQKVPQVGQCILGSNVEVGANCTIDRGSIGRTVIGQGTKIDNLVHIAHNVHVGPRSLIVAQVGIAGSTRVGEGAQFGGQSGVVGHIEIGAGAQIAAKAGVIGDVAPGEVVVGYPARERRSFFRSMGWLRRIPELHRRLKVIEERVGAPEPASKESE